MLLEHQVLHSLHDELRAGIHHSGKQPAEEGGQERRGEERRGEGEETKGTNRRRGIKEGGRR